jgi:hemerythrin-like domain-containing protein
VNTPFIGKENDVLFPMAEKRLATDKLEKLYEGFATRNACSG